MSEKISGVWTYRSLLNLTDLSLPFNDLAFGGGIIELIADDAGAISGTLGGAGWSLALMGSVLSEDPKTYRWQGRGMIGGEEWVYDYLCYRVPDWPGGVDQRDSLVGSIIRTESHSGGAAEAGFSASFYAVRND